MTPSNPKFSPPTPAERDRNLTIIRAIDEATSHLSEGLASLARPGWSIDEHAATFTALASGIERLAKVCIGLAGLDDTGKWSGSRGDGHDLSKLRGKLDALLDQRSAKAVHPKYINQLRADLNKDPALPLIFAALEAWAATPGRYGTLDALAGKPPTTDRPEHIWMEAEEAATTPEILAGLGDPTGWAVNELRQSMARSILLWWFVIYRAWSHGVFGPLARQLSGEIDPTRPRALAAFARAELSGL